jgi:hypothetical protein
MNLNKLKISMMFCALSAATLAVPDVSAASIRVTCEKRGVTRSKVSVDGAGLAAGTYTAVVVSAGKQVKSARPQAAVRGEVEFDFDSNRADILEGATAIPKTFITNTATVTGKIVNSRGMTVVSDTEACRVRSR